MSKVFLIRLLLSRNILRNSCFISKIAQLSCFTYFFIFYVIQSKYLLTEPPSHQKGVPMSEAFANIYTDNDYYSLPENVRAELIDGQIYYMEAPSRIHQEILVFLFKKIADYIEQKRGNCKVYPAPFAVQLFEDNDRNVVEPDISIICDQNKLTDRGCTGAPDWIIEIISPSTSSHDYIRKLNLYAAAGVKEYWITNPINQSVYVYFLEKDRFKTVAYTFQDKIKVNIYHDLWIDFAELAL